jgi:hypothetical protein
LNANTVSEYSKVIEACKAVFEKKTRDYGTSWRILRLPSITDQILIKAQRIRSIQEKGMQKIDEGIANEFIGIINYCIIAIIQSELTDEMPLEMPFEEVMERYDRVLVQTSELFTDKNHDYNEAWRSMRVSSMTDIILMKLLRVKQIENNNGKTIASEGLVPNYQDMLNYAVFCLILLNETEPHANS